MNLNDNPDIKQLAELIRHFDDSESHHILWVSHDGEVHVSPLPEEMLPAQFDPPNLKFRVETLQRGNGYVGPEAAADSEWLESALGMLTDNWARGTNGWIPET